MSISELKKWAKEKVEGKKKWKVLVAVVIYGIISSLSVTLYKTVIGSMPFSISFPIGSIVASIIEIGLIEFLIDFIKDKSNDLDQLFSRFKEWKEIIWLWLNRYVRIFLWSLLFVVPGIIKSLGYSLTSYIYLDNPKMATKDILKLSEDMMQGHKMDLFILNLSFLGWHLLAILTLGILEIWIIPYQQIATVKFLYDVKENYKEKDQANA